MGADMRYEAQVREITDHFNRQASALKVWRWGSLIVLACAIWGLAAGGGLPATLAFVVGFVYWRDVRSREQYLQNSRHLFDSQMAFARALAECRGRLGLDPPQPRSPFAELLRRKRDQGGGPTAKRA